MDEIENPALPAAGETSPTIRPISDEETDPTQDGANLSTLPILQSGPLKPARPDLKRDNSVPPAKPPPAVPSQPNERRIEDFSQEAPDSLTLADLKRLRSSFPTGPLPNKKETLQDFETVYEFEYADAQSMPVELEEWFTYSEKERARLRYCKAAFDMDWRRETEGNGPEDWLDVTEDHRREFVQGLVLDLMAAEHVDAMLAPLLTLTYISLGVWEETAGRHEGVDLEELFIDGTKSGSGLESYRSSTLQMQWIIAMVDTFQACDTIQAIFEVLQKLCAEAFTTTPPENVSRNETPPRRADESMELWCCLTILYVVLEVARTSSGARGKNLRGAVAALEPNLLNALMKTIAQLRWNDSAPIPLTKMLLLSWKAILVLFGGIKDIELIKQSMQEGEEEEKDSHGQPIITASPLDYHLFRQEISSKYPAYQPPPPLFSLEPENNSILPPLKHRRPRSVVNDVFAATQPVVGTDSLMHQPVHIATPAPSPPPSPAIPGKAGKKQNYQTNQMFPFLYPPLEESSNQLGGKGTTEEQDLLVGRKWEGCDIPTSILEAAELFAKRMRAPRAMRQLWTTRVDYMRYERGYKGDDEEEYEDDAAAAIEQDDGFELLPKPGADETAEQGEPLVQNENDQKLTAVDQFYRDSLPYLQSVIIILLKAVLQHVTDVVTRIGGQNGLQAGIQFNENNAVPNGIANNIDLNDTDDRRPESSSEERDKIRSQEIAAKALSSILLLLLKWFKLNHVLQHEYMTQLLLDSNYVPLILKLWQVQEIGRACHIAIDREELNFFYLCQTTSRKGPPVPEPSAKEPVEEEPEADDSEDEAVPPPIALRREVAEESQPTQLPQAPRAVDATHPPEIDELGYPITQLPTTPIKHYSYRNVVSYINYLRVLQKVTRRKTHRALLLVNFKSSNHLRKTLKVPIKELRYYTLKLFKSQVPFCGRKWRQGNMKIITAVWLSVPAELRDDWLAGGGGNMGGAGIGDVDGTVDDALPLEQSLRALTHWWNVRNYHEAMGVDKGLLDEEIDFFQREIEKIELARALVAGDELVMNEGSQDEGWQSNPIEGF